MKLADNRDVMKEYVFIGIGEILWDVIGDTEKLGGAPANFCFYASQLGGKSYPVSAVGDDLRGKKALEELAMNKLATEYIQVIDGAQTGYVLANIDEGGVATYTFPDNVAWDNLNLKDDALMLATTADCICFGTLGQRSAKSKAAIFSFLMVANPGCLKVFDINLRQELYSRETVSESLAMCDIAKLNDEELTILSRMENLEGNNEDMLKHLVKKYNLKLCVLTKGEGGAVLTDGEKVSIHDGFQAHVADTIGAGDAFTAAVATAFLQKKELDTINAYANKVASCVCEKQGAMSVIDKEKLNN